MSRNTARVAAWFFVGTACGLAAALLTASRRGKGFAAYARGREAKEVVQDAADVIRRGRRLKRPLEEN